MKQQVTKRSLSFSLDDSDEEEAMVDGELAHALRAPLGPIRRRIKGKTAASSVASAPQSALPAQEIPAASTLTGEHLADGVNLKI